MVVVITKAKKPPRPSRSRVARPTVRSRCRRGAPESARSRQIAALPSDGVFTATTKPKVTGSNPVGPAPKRPQSWAFRRFWACCPTTASSYSAVIRTCGAARRLASCRSLRFRAGANVDADAEGCAAEREPTGELHGPAALPVVYLPPMVMPPPVRAVRRVGSSRPGATVVEPPALSATKLISRHRAGCCGSPGVVRVGIAVSFDPDPPKSR